MSAVDDANEAVRILEDAIGNTRIMLSMREIMQRTRAEYDYIWKSCNRDFDPASAVFNLADYCAKLETLLMNRLAEAGLSSGMFGNDGIAGWERDKENRQADAEKAMSARLYALQMGLDGLKTSITGFATQSVPEPSLGANDAVFVDNLPGLFDAVAPGYLTGLSGYSLGLTDNPASDNPASDNSAGTPGA